LVAFDIVAAELVKITVLVPGLNVPRLFHAPVPPEIVSVLPLPSFRIPPDCMLIEPMVVLAGKVGSKFVVAASGIVAASDTPGIPPTQLAALFQLVLLAPNQVKAGVVGVPRVQ